MNEGPERIDYRETSDVTEVHAAIKREHRDPIANVTPIPLWLTAVCGVAICWAGVYVGVFNGGFSGDIYNEYESSPAALFPLPKTAGGANGPVVAAQSLAQQGKAIYAQCQACHQGNGMGTPGAIPPLAKSEFVTGGEKRLLAILLKGVQGAITVEGKTYNGVMPAWEKSLSDKKIAAVASYVRSEWGNGAPEISEAKVAAARKEFEAQSASWTEADLLKIPAEANFTEVAGAAPAAAAASATAAAAAPSGGDDAAILAAGKAGYSAICLVCHQATGTGLPPVFPPLKNSEYVNGDPKRLSAIILKGVMGPITVDGKAFNGVMPAQEMSLDDKKIAAIATYVRSAFGEKAGPVSPDVVAAARKEFADKKTGWSEAELKAFGSSPANVAPAPAPAP
jgi:mono/diheme cytochrome c family protein